MPSSVPYYTDWVLLENSKVQSVIGTFGYLNKITFLNLQKNRIKLLPDSFINEVIQSENLKWLNLANNKLTSLPLTVQKLNNLEQIWLSGNPFYCDCEMTWMTGWLNNFTTPSGKHAIIDYKQLKCNSGMMVERPIYKLDKVEMGCFPAKLTLWQKLAIEFAAGIAVTIISGLTVLVIKRSRDIKFFLYYYCKWCSCFGIPKDDKNEYLNSMEYDAYLSYRYI